MFFLLLLKQYNINNYGQRCPHSHRKKWKCRIQQQLTWFCEDEVKFDFTIRHVITSLLITLRLDDQLRGFGAEFKKKNWKTNDNNNNKNGYFKNWRLHVALLCQKKLLQQALDKKRAAAPLLKTTGEVLGVLDTMRPVWVRTYSLTILIPSDWAEPMMRLTTFSIEAFLILKHSSSPFTLAISYTALTETIPAVSWPSHTHIKRDGKQISEDIIKKMVIYVGVGRWRIGVNS